MAWPTTDQIKAMGAGVVTILTGAITVWWLIEVASQLGMKPVVQHGTVVLDEFQRAKDILLVVFPLFSASVAYWVGSSGTADAKKDAAKANNQVKAVLDAAPEGTMAAAKQSHPEAFAQ